VSEKLSTKSNDVATLVAGNIAFATDLYSRLASNSPDNLFFSPSSISLALSMVLAGARGETAEELTHVLHLSPLGHQVHEAFQALRSAIRTGGVELRIANRLWGQAGYHFHEDFLRTTETCYGAGLAEVEFRTDPERARLSINTWIEDQTANRIKNLLNPGDVDGMTRLVLTNAIYFLGAWDSEFDEVNTEDKPFHLGRHKTTIAPTMHQTGWFRYSEFPDLQVVELPYKSRFFELRDSDNGIGQEYVERIDGGSDLAMCIFLPRQSDGLSGIEAQLTPESLNKWLPKVEADVSVAMPKFRIESGLALKDTLSVMGVSLAFSEKADFTGITDDPEGVYLSEAIHKAFVDVNEKGTEAAAATAAIMRGGSAMMPPPPKVFRADHPFLFLIRDCETQTILFCGRVASPL
jgi:serpin B